MDDTTEPTAVEKNREALWAAASQHINHALPENAEKRASSIAHLRYTADLLEHAPEKLTGLLLVTAEKVVRSPDDSGTHTLSEVIGSSPAVVAMYSGIKHVIEDAIEECAEVQHTAALAEGLHPSTVYRAMARQRKEKR